MVAVSVLIRTIGRTEALKDALHSLQQQSFKDFEVIVVEDGPATLAGFLTYYDDLTLHYKALGSRKGRSHAGNQALAMAQGEYCLFLDEDDALYPTHLESLMQAALQGNHAVIYSWSEERAVERTAEGTITRKGRFTRYRYERFSLLHLMAHNFLPINAVLFKRALYEKAGGFDEDIDCLEDWLLWLKFAALEPSWLCVPRITAIYHVPFNLRVRRKEFSAWHAQVGARMQTIIPAWSIATVHNELKKNFGMTLFLRKLYYYAVSYIKRP